MIGTARFLPAMLALSLLATPAALARVHVEGELIIPPVVIAPGAPPPLRVEPVPPPPGPPEAVVWAPGHWEWSGRSYFWVSGHYVERPEVGLFWEPGRWIDRHGHWEWIGGHWRR
jgi:hypothetical protein